MKKIEAIIRKTKFEDVKEALLNSDIDWFEYHDVHGIGQSRQERIYRGVQYSTDVIERVKITIVCREQFVDPTVLMEKLLYREEESVKTEENQDENEENPEENNEKNPK